MVRTEERPASTVVIPIVSALALARRCPAPPGGLDILGSNRWRAGIGSKEVASTGETCGRGQEVERVPRPDGSAAVPDQLKSAGSGAGSVSDDVKTKCGIAGQRAATFSSGECISHCRGSVGVAGRSGVAGTTWTM